MIGARGIAEAGAFQKFVVELRFDRGDRNITAVLGFVGVVEMRAAIKNVGFALIAPEAGAVHAV